MQKFFHLAIVMLRPLLSSFPRLRLVAAIVVAEWFDLSQKAAALRAALKTKEQVPTLLKAQRLEICERCIVFDHRLRTCGTPLPGGKSDIENGKPLGCMCQMDAKAGTLANCWAYEHFNGETIIGWPERLNSFPLPTKGDDNA